MAVVDHPGKIFDFLNMPRELRDRCFEEMLVPQLGMPLAGEEDEQDSEPLIDSDGEDDDDEAPSASIQIEHSPTLPLMLVSHQFSDEYLSTARRCMVMSIARLRYNTATDFRLPSVLCGVRRISLDCTIECESPDTRRYHSYHSQSCGVKMRFEQAQDLLFNLLCQMEKPDVFIDVQVISRCRRLASCMEAAIHHQRLLTRTLGLTKLLVRVCSWEIAPKLEGKAPLWLEFDHKTKELEEVAASVANFRFDERVLESWDEMQDVN